MAPLPILSNAKEHLEQNYTCKEEFRGAGTYGKVSVYTTKNPNLPQQVAVKTVQDSKHARREIDSLKKAVNEPNIVKLLGYNEFPFYIVMECCNDDLAALAEKRNFDLNQDDLFKVCLDTLKGLESLEKLQIVHRDIKPRNLFVDYCGSDGSCFQLFVVKVGDLGECRAVNKEKLDKGEHNELTKDVGTPGYVAPELAALLDWADCKYSFKVDVWSLGASLIYLAGKGQKPLTEEFLRNLLNEVTTCERRDKEILDKIRECIREEEFPAIVSIVEHMLKWDESERYSAHECIGLVKHLRTQELTRSQKESSSVLTKTAIPQQGKGKNGFNPENEVTKYKERKRKDLEKTVKCGPEDTQSDTIRYEYSPAESYVNRTMTRQPYIVSKKQDDLTISGSFALARASQEATEETTPEKLWDGATRTVVTEPKFWPAPVDNAAKSDSINSGSVFLLRASAGVGKTCFTEYALYQFCAGAGDAKFWGQFELVLLVPCRGIISLQNQEMKNLIMDICFPHLEGSDRDFMFSYLEHLAASHKLCIIYDGVDELPKESTFVKDLLEHPSLSEAHILITGRPNSVQEVISFLQRGISKPGQQSKQVKPFSVVDLMGLKSHQILQYFHRVHCLDTGCEKQCERLYAKVKNNLMLKNLTSIPVYASMYALCEKHFSEKSPVNLVNLFVQFLIGQIRDHGIGISSEDIEVWFEDLAANNPDVIEMFRSLAKLAFKVLKNESFEKLSGSSQRCKISPTDRQLIIEGVKFPSRTLLNKIGFLWTEISKTGKVTGHFVHLNFIEFQTALHTLINGLKYPANEERQRFCLAFACGLVSPVNEFPYSFLKALRKDDPVLPTPDSLIDDYFRKRMNNDEGIFRGMLRRMNLVSNISKSSDDDNREGLFRGETKILSSFDCGTLALAVHEAQTKVKLSIIPDLHDCTIKIRGRTNYSSLELQAIVYLVATHGTALEIDRIKIKGGSCLILEMIGLLDSWVHNQQLTPQIKVGQFSVDNTPEEKIKDSVVASVKLISDVSTINIDGVEIKEGSSFILKEGSSYILKLASRWTSEIQITNLTVDRSLEKEIEEAVVAGLKRVSRVKVKEVEIERGSSYILENVTRWASKIEIGELTVHGLEDGLNQTVADGLGRVTHVGTLSFEKRSGSLPSDLPAVSPATVSLLSSLSPATVASLPPLSPATISHMSSLASTTCTRIDMVDMRLGSLHSTLLESVGRSEDTNKVQNLWLGLSDVSKVDVKVLALAVPAVNYVNLSAAKLSSEQVTAILAAIADKHPLRLKQLELRWLVLSGLECGVVSRAVAAVEVVDLDEATLTRDQVLHLLTYINGSNCNIEKLYLSGVKILHGDWKDEDIQKILYKVTSKIKIER